MFGDIEPNDGPGEFDAAGGDGGLTTIGALAACCSSEEAPTLA
jgi:hypothetical protein